jgi:hypothetical protein
VKCSFVECVGDANFLHQTWLYIFDVTNAIYNAWLQHTITLINVDFSSANPSAQIRFPFLIHLKQQNNNPKNTSHTTMSSAAISKLLDKCSDWDKVRTTTNNHFAFLRFRRFTHNATRLTLCCLVLHLLRVVMAGMDVVDVRCCHQF